MEKWDHKIPAEVKEGPADCIRMAEVRAVLKKMKMHKAPGLSGLVAEMIQATGYWNLVDIRLCLRCFDAVGWAAGRASGR